MQQFDTEMKLIKGLVLCLYVNILYHGTSGNIDTRMGLMISSIEKHQDRIDDNLKLLKLDLETVNKRIDNLTNVNTSSNTQPQITNSSHFVQRLYAAFKQEKNISRKLMDELTLTKYFVESLKLKYDNNENKHRYLDSEVDNIKQKLNESKREVEMALNLQQQNIKKFANTTTKLTEITSDLEKNSKGVLRDNRLLQERIIDLTSMTHKLEQNFKMLAQITMSGNDYSNTKCPTNWVLIGSSLYMLNKEFVTWDGAQKKCRDKCARLMEFHSEEQNRLITDTFGSCDRDFWIGATDRDLEGFWIWKTSGLPVSNVGFSNWGKGEPNNDRGMEHCAHMRSYYGDWNDKICTSSLQFICEKTYESVTTLQCN